jgi:hypothetical protein
LRDGLEISAAADSSRARPPQADRLRRFVSIDRNSVPAQ